MSIWDVVSGGLNYLTGQQTNKANTAANNATIGANAANQEKGLQALTGDSQFKNITRNADGGFNTTQPGATSAADARASAAMGDVDRISRINEATGGFDFKLPTIADAQGVVDRDLARIDTAIIQPGLDKIIKAKTRQFGGLNNSGADANTIDALSRFAAENKIGRETNAYDLFNKQAEADSAILSQLINNMQPQAGAPAFTDGTPGVSASQLIGSTKPPATVPNLSGAILPAAGSSVIDSIMAQQTRDQNQKNQIAIIRALGNEGAFS